jgi:serine/threonine-protein kinase
MVSLTLLHPRSAKPLRQWRFDAEPVIRIGRSPTTNQVILDDPVVSRFHLELIRVEFPPENLEHPVYSWQLVNHSMNGTFLDGVEVDRAILADEAVIQLAQDGPRLQFESKPRSPASNDLSPPAIAATLPVARQSTIPNRCTHEGNPPGNLFCMHCGQPIDIKRTIRQYQVLQTLGRGGMGTTYLVWDTESEPQLSPPATQALRVLKEMNADIAQIPKAQELFEREANTLQSLNHPGIPKYYDFFIEDNKKYLVMELIHGRDLEKRVRKEGAVSVQQAIVWMIQTCEVLDYLHNRPVPIIHRDIKPGNLLVRHLDQQVIVLDFGAVKEAGMPVGTRIGAEGYGAPEQIQGRPLPQSDLYAIGPSLAFLLTGINPLLLRLRGDPLRRLDLDKLQDIPRRLRLVIQRLTEADPAERYQSAKDLIRALKNCL